MEFGELLKQFLIDLQSVFRTQLKKLDLTLSQIILISSIPIGEIGRASCRERVCIYV